MADEEQREVRIHFPPELLGGVWANYARVSHSPHEFTLDFIRVDETLDPSVAVVVSRVNVSPLFITQLIDALQDNWAKYADKALPKEVRDDDQENSG